jgi:hypothetical protein
VSDEPLSFVSRLVLAHVAWARILTDGSYAARVARLDAPESPSPLRELSPSPPAPPAIVVTLPPEPAAPRPSLTPTPTPDTSALLLLARLQSEGRLVDFLEDDVRPYSDAEVGAAARVVHEGCRRALREVLPVSPLRSEAEGATMVLADDFDKDVYKLTGNVTGAAPFRGVLRHRGWRVDEVKLGTRTGGDPLVVAPAEVEL